MATYEPATMLPAIFFFVSVALFSFRWSPFTAVHCHGLRRTLQVHEHVLLEQKDINAVHEKCMYHTFCVRFSA